MDKIENKLTDAEIKSILNKDFLNKADIVNLLNTSFESTKVIFDHSARVKEFNVSNIVYFRGLIEFSNICIKDCFYCGIRSSNNKILRYNLDDKEILQTARFALEQNYASIVLQSGEITGSQFIKRITVLIKEIKKMSKGQLGITLSLGEQTEQTYKEWFEAGAHRYLLRIETSNPMLYKKIHPENENHLFETRIKCLEYIRKLGYQVGTGVMMGLPFQTTEDMADDLLFMQGIDVDMVGMGPYIEHPDTPLYGFRNLLMQRKERLQICLKMISILRIMMKNINIAAATALQAIDPMGREKALKIGANVIMPNITPGKYRKNYLLYDSKPCIDENPDDCTQCLEARIKMTGNSLGFGKWGDSLHFIQRK